MWLCWKFLFVCLFFLTPSLTMYPRLAPNLPSSSLTHQSPGVTGMHHSAWRKICFWFRGCLRERACCEPFRHFSLNKIDDLALDGMIHLIALSLPVGCLSSDTALISWVRKERLCQTGGWHEPKPGERVAGFPGKSNWSNWPRLDTLSKITKLSWINQVRL